MAALQKNIYVTRKLPEIVTKGLISLHNVKSWSEEHRVVPRGTLLKEVEGCHGILCLLTDKIDRQLLDAAGGKLTVISTMSVGHDHIDLEECRKRGISIGYTPNVLTEATAELTVTLVLTLARRINEGISAVRSGEWGTWSPFWMCGTQIKGSTIGIVGFGRIGRSVMEKLKGFSPKELLFYSKTKKDSQSCDACQQVGLHDLLARSDIVIVCCSLTPETHCLFDKERFQLMKKSALLINTSRGSVVDQDALLEALKNGTIGGAALDVTTPEPLPTDHELLGLRNCIVVPHIGSATHSTRMDMARLAVENLILGLEGQPMISRLV